MDKPPVKNQAAVVGESFGVGFGLSLALSALSGSGGEWWGFRYWLAVLIGAVGFGGVILFLRGTPWTPVVHAAEADPKAEFLKLADEVLADPPGEQQAARGRCEPGIKP